MNISLDCKLSLYADDSALLTFTSKLDSQLINELGKCKQWLDDNKLSLHVGKTECLLFGSKRRLKGAENFHIHCDGTSVERKFCVKYLGVTLDTNMNGSAHVGNLMKVCAGRLAFLYRYSSLLDKKCRQTLCASQLS